MATIKINGTIISVSGQRGVSIVNGKVIVNGVDVTPEGKNISIEVHGDVEKVDVDACNQITVTGAVGLVQTASGDVKCRTVTGSVSTASGDVQCADVGGSVSTASGDVSASKISGRVSTVSGDVN